MPSEFFRQVYIHSRFWPDIANTAGDVKCSQVHNATGWGACWWCWAPYVNKKILWAFLEKQAIELQTAVTVSIITLTQLFCCHYLQVNSTVIPWESHETGQQVCGCRWRWDLEIFFFYNHPQCFKFILRVHRVYPNSPRSHKYLLRPAKIITGSLWVTQRRWWRLTDFLLGLIDETLMLQPLRHCGTRENPIHFIHFPILTLSFSKEL